MVIAANEDVQVKIVPTTTRYRLLPTSLVDAVSRYREKLDKCQREDGTGHVLIIRKGNIVCDSCGMEWSDQGS
ncbi:MAG TPA: hypothetical protein VN861_03460 [Candidatus Acidoferrales bacterium]|nr:hypothetical protein [Candidatus Acidoferrales bacterium]